MIVLALPKGRILDECGPLLAAAGITPAPDYADESSRRLRFPTNHANLDVIRTRSFDIATFVAFGAAQIGICGGDVLMEFDYPEIYAPLDLNIGHCRVSVAEPKDEAGTTNLTEISRILFPLFDEIILTRVTSPRAADPAQLAEIAATLGAKTRVVEHPPTALAAAIALTPPEGLLVIAGSVYLVGELRPLLVDEK